MVRSNPALKELKAISDDHEALMKRIKDPESYIELRKKHIATPFGTMPLIAELISSYLTNTAGSTSPYNMTICKSENGHKRKFILDLPLDEIPTAWATCLFGQCMLIA